MEWASPDFHFYAYWPFAFMMALGVISWARSRTPPSWSDVLLFLGTAAAGLMSKRHIALFAVIATPIIARALALSLQGTQAHAFLSGRGSDTPPIWRRLPVFIDGRADPLLYGNEFLSYYFKTFGMEGDWRKPLEDFGVTYALLERASPLGTLLMASGEWREAYADEVARVFIRSAPFKLPLR